MSLLTRGRIHLRVLGRDITGWRLHRYRRAPELLPMRLIA